MPRAVTNADHLGSSCLIEPRSSHDGGVTNVRSFIGAGPDARLLAKARRALDAWETRADEPTSNLLGTGAIRELERRGAEALGCSYGLALPSATLALRVALEALGVGPGDQVLIPAYDWTAAVSATRSIGAIPVAIDVELPGCGMDPDVLATAELPLAKAVIVTHLFGVPARIANIATWCRRRGLLLIEDCSQALGAEVGGARVGSFGDAAVCSFGSGKIVDAEDGGLVASSRRSVFERCVQASQHPLRQTLVGVDEVNVATLALRMHPLAAIIALAELDDLGQTLLLRRGALADLNQRLSQHGWLCAVRSGCEAIGPALPVLARAALTPPSGIVLTAPGQSVIGPALAARHRPSRRADRVSTAVRLAWITGRESAA